MSDGKKPQPNFVESQKMVPPSFAEKGEGQTGRHSFSGGHVFPFCCIVQRENDL